MYVGKGHHCWEHILYVCVEPIDLAVGMPLLLPIYAVNGLAHISHHIRPLF
jgi:hypothetical protein